jgi:hypothetical protein
MGGVLTDTLRVATVGVMAGLAAAVVAVEEFRPSSEACSRATP